MSPTPKPHRDSPRGVPSTFFAQGGGENADGFAFEEVGVEWAAEVTDTGGDGFVGFEFGDDGVVGGDGLAGGAGGVGTGGGPSWCEGAKGWRHDWAGG